MDRHRALNEALTVLAMPAANVRTIEDAAELRATTCGNGCMRWRIWGSGPPLVLLHGDFGSWTHWLRNIVALANHFRVFVPDMPGYGDSDSAPEPFLPEGLAKILAEGLAQLVPPPQRYDLAGFSFGGIVAGHLAACERERVENLALLGPGGFGLKRSVQLPGLRRLATDMSGSDVLDVYRHNLAALMIAIPARVDNLAVYLQIENTRRSRARAGDIPKTDTLFRVLSDVSARIHGIWGGCDAMSFSQLGAVEEILRHFQVDLDFRIIEGAGHWTPYESCDVVNATLLDMFGKTYVVTE
jgi:pimeloyl-ACP methyl ester carboxylesterase